MDPMKARQLITEHLNEVHAHVHCRGPAPRLAEDSAEYQEALRVHRADVEEARRKPVKWDADHVLRCGRLGS